MFNRFENFPKRHMVLTPSDGTPLKTQMIIYAGSDGDITIVDDVGVSITYTVTAGTVLPVMASKVMDTGTDVDPVVGLF